MECIYPARPTFGEAVGMVNAFTCAGDLAEYLQRAKVRGRRAVEDDCALAWHFGNLVPDVTGVDVYPTHGHSSARVVADFEDGSAARCELAPPAGLFVARFDVGHYPRLIRV